MSPYQERVLKQAEAWLAGNPYHNFIDGECCPDFSCCQPDLFTRDEQSRRDYLARYLEQIGTPS